MTGQPNAQSTTLALACDVYDVAQLAGGPARVVDTAVVGLLEDGRLRADGVGRLQAVGRATHPVEAAVLDVVGPQARRSVGTIRLRAADDPRITALADRLVAEGLLRRNPLAGLSSSWPAHLRTAAGRRVLEEWTTAAPAGRRGVDVALGGPSRAADRAVVERVFGPAPQQHTRPGRRHDRYAGQDTGATGGWLVGGGGDGGGGGWGDGGCGGGGDGGGGC